MISSKPIFKEVQCPMQNFLTGIRFCQRTSSPSGFCKESGRVHPVFEPIKRPSIQKTIDTGSHNSIAVLSALPAFLAKSRSPRWRPASNKVVQYSSCSHFLAFSPSEVYDFTITNENTMMSVAVVCSPGIDVITRLQIVATDFIGKKPHACRCGCVSVCVWATGGRAVA